MQCHGVLYSALESSAKPISGRGQTDLASPAPASGGVRRWARLDSDTPAKRRFLAAGCAPGCAPSGHVRTVNTDDLRPSPALASRRARLRAAHEVGAGGLRA